MILYKSEGLTRAVERNRKRVEKRAVKTRRVEVRAERTSRGRRLEAGEVVLDGEVEVVGGEALWFAVYFAEVFDLPQ